MAIDKAIDSVQLDADLTVVADAIREKGGTTDALTFPDGFAAAIGAIEAAEEDADALLAALVGDTLTELHSTAITKVAQYTFRGHTALTKINLPNCTAIGGDAFGNCTGVTEVRFDSFVSGHGPNCLVGMSSLETVYMPSCTATPGFRNATKLKNVTFSPNLKTLTSEAFYNTGIEEAIFPTVTAMYNHVFRDCPSLKKVDIDNSGWYIEGNVCQNAAVLETFIMRSTNFCRLGATTAFAGTPIESGTGYIYVPAALVEEYKAATNWAVYADQIRAIEDYPEITGG